MRSVSMTVCAAEKTFQHSVYFAARDANSASALVHMLLLLPPLLEAKPPTSSLRGTQACVAEEKEQLLRLRCREKDAEPTIGEPPAGFTDAADTEGEDAATAAAVAKAWALSTSLEMEMVGVVLRDRRLITSQHSASALSERDGSAGSGGASPSDASDEPQEKVPSSCDPSEAVSPLLPEQEPVLVTGEAAASSDRCWSIR
jgi:hypothetical protein